MLADLQDNFLSDGANTLNILRASPFEQHQCRELTRA